jgi:hypothetical protein
MALTMRTVVAKRILISANERMWAPPTWNVACEHRPRTRNIA